MEMRIATGIGAGIVIGVGIGRKFDRCQLIDMNIKGVQYFGQFYH